MLTFLRFWAGADVDLIAQFSLEPQLDLDVTSWGPMEMFFFFFFFGWQALVLLVSPEDKGFLLEDSGPVQGTVQVNLTRPAIKETGKGHLIHTILTQQEGRTKPQY